MIKKTLATVLLSSFAIAASAHQVWVERDGAGPAKVYVGDVDGERDHGDDVAKAGRDYPGIRQGQQAAGQTHNYQ